MTEKKKKKKTAQTAEVDWAADLRDAGIAPRGFADGNAACDVLLPLVQQLERRGLKEGDIELFLGRVVKAVVFRQGRLNPWRSSP